MSHVIKISVIISVIKTVKETMFMARELNLLLIKTSPQICHNLRKIQQKNLQLVMEDADHE